MAIVLCVRLINVTLGFYFKCTAEEPVVTRKEIWETWYFWFGICLVFLFIIISIISYFTNSCKRKQQNLIRIRNLSHYSSSAPAISTVSGPGGIIQPDVRHFNNQIGAEPSDGCHLVDLTSKSFASPLSAPYPPVEPVTVIRGSAPSQGYRQTEDYTEIVLPPGYIDSDSFKR